MRYAMRSLIALILVTAGCSKVEGPIIVVTAKYPGANAQVVAETVAAPIEQQVNGVEGMSRLESESRSDGTYVALVRFNRGIDSNVVLQLVRNRVALANPVLPEAVQRAGLTVEAKAAAKAENHVAIVLLDRGQSGSDVLRRFSDAVLKQLSAEGAIVSPEVFPGPEEDQPQVNVDPEKCREYNVPVADVMKAVDAARGKNANQLKSVTVRSAKGETVALGQLVTIAPVNRPTGVYRVNMYPAVRIAGTPPQGTTADSATSKCVQIADAIKNAPDRPASLEVIGGF